MSKELLTTDICAKQYAMMHKVKCTKRLNQLYNEGRLIFSDMTKYSDNDRKLSLIEFSMTHILSVVILSVRAEI